MSAQHTPGPWEWSDQEMQPLGEQWSLAPGILIADGRDGTPGGDEIDRANARLIAAAPELLEALVWALSELRGKTRYDNPQQALNCFDLADAAIAKATGGAA